MRHQMKLNEGAFERIKNGTKTVEFRLYDEKRRKVKIGDKIEFLKLPDMQQSIIVEVLDIYQEETFERLFNKIYKGDKEKIKERVESIRKYYSIEKEKRYGAIGIKIKLLSNNYRYIYNKLVRDKIPENIDSKQGRKCKYRVLNDTEYLQELNKKVLEEANEFIEENSIEELGDLIEVIKAIMNLKGYNIEDVKKAMQSKEKKKGKFNNKIFLEYVDEEKRNLEEEKELSKDYRKLS